MGQIKLSEITKVVSVAVVVNVLFASLLFFWVTTEDIEELPNNPIDKFITLFTFGLATFTTSGFVNTNAKSRRLKIVSALYVILVISGLLGFFFNF